MPPSQHRLGLQAQAQTLGDAGAIQGFHRMQSRTPWEHIRGVLILLHILAVVLMALPAPEGAMRKDTWNDPTVTAEFEAWADRLNGMGYETNTEDLKAEMFDVAKEFIDIRRTVLAPTVPYARYLGTQQSWRMFVAPHRFPSRLHVEIKRSDSDWEPISIYQDPEYRWKAELFEHDRFRSALFRYGWKSYAGARKLFNQWLAREAAQDFPDATHIRTRWYKYKTPTPEMVKAGEEFDGKYVLSQVLKLDQYRESP